MSERKMKHEDANVNVDEELHSQDAMLDEEAVWADDENDEDTGDWRMKLLLI